MNNPYNNLDNGLRDKFSELKNLENYWALSKEKQLITNKMVESIEADILYKSEEVKRIIGGNGSQYNNTHNSVSDYRGGDLNTAFNNSTLKDNPSNVAASNVAISNSEVRRIPLEILPVSKKIVDKNLISSDVSNDILQRGNRLVLNVDINRLITFDSSKYFYLSNGIVLCSLKDLMMSLPRMDDSTFYNHVNSQKNDFANWIEGVFNQRLLADAIRFMKTKQELQDYLITLMD